MKKASATNYKVGSLREFAEWTKRVVRDPKASNGVPKKWFANEQMVERAARNPHRSMRRQRCKG